MSKSSDDDIVEAEFTVGGTNGRKTKITVIEEVSEEVQSDVIERAFKAAAAGFIFATAATEIINRLFHNRRQLSVKRRSRRVAIRRKRRR